MRIAFSVLAVTLLIVTVTRERGALAQALQQLSIVSLVASGLLVVAGLVAQMLSWRALFAGRGSNLPSLRASAQIYYIGQLGKYVPGSVWAVVAQSELGAEHRLSRSRSAVVALGALAVLVVTGTGVATTALSIIARVPAVVLVGSARLASGVLPAHASSFQPPDSDRTQSHPS